MTRAEIRELIARASCWENGCAQSGCNLVQKCRGNDWHLSSHRSRADAILSALDAKGLWVAPKECTEEMMEEVGEVAANAYNIAVSVNTRTHEELMARHPEIVKPREKFGAAPCQVLPVLWRAMRDAWIGGREGDHEGE